MNMEDVREYESQLQKETNSILKQNVTPSETNQSISSGAGDATETMCLPSLGNSQPETPRTPKSPSKKGYFSNWF